MARRRHELLLPESDNKQLVTDNFVTRRRPDLLLIKLGQQSLRALVHQHVR